MTRLFLLFTFVLTGTLLTAQEAARFTVSLSTDSLLLGNYLQVSFQLENAEGDDFTAPSFDGFHLVAGPNISTSYSMVNGEVSRSATYSYYLEPLDVGNYFIEPAAVRVADRVLETEPVEVLVLPNPDGLIQQPEPFRQQFEFRFEDFGLPPFFEPGQPLQPAPEQKEKKKKRKIYRL